MSIYIKLSGGLGNQLFQYALGRSLAINNSCDLWIDTAWFSNIPLESTPREILLKDFNTKANFIDLAGEHEKLFRGKNWLDIFSQRIKTEKKYFKYDEGISKIKNPIYLNGYWQSYKYFENIRSDLLTEITPKLIGVPNYIIYERLIKNSNNPVAIHVRRGDYVSSKSASKIHEVLSINYYKKAIEAIKCRTKNQTLFFFSDDIDWVKEHFKNLENCHFIEPMKKNESVVQELYLMSLCENYIIANSSLSWWGAWLGKNKNKVVLYPEKWVSNISQISSTDLIPKDWISLDSSI
jgi:hypothetical protein